MHGSQNKVIFIHLELGITTDSKSNLEVNENEKNYLGVEMK